MEAASDPDFELISARDFITFDTNNHPNWQGKTLFIDGLDELRVGGSDPRMQLDQIRKNLDRLGRPRFRISCRHADWLLTDQTSLDSVSPSGVVTVLYLDPFDIKSVSIFLRRNFKSIDANRFILEAHNRGVDGLLFNPQTLNMLAETVSAHGWPSSRRVLFEQACQSMALEFNHEHLDAKQSASEELILDASGHICAALLVSNTAGVAATHTLGSVEFPDIGQIGLSPDVSQEATSTNLFRRQTNHVEFVHRHVAEFLAARWLASKIEKGLPVPRVLANMTDSQGNVVSSLRGLSAWLAAHSKIARRCLIARDPVGVALYGDINDFSADERSSLFQSLIRDPHQLAPMYESASAFSSLVTPLMQDVLERTLKSPADHSNVAVVREFILRLYAESPPVSCMRETFFDFVRDEDQPSHVKLAALIALVKYSQSDASEHSLVPLAADIIEGRISDPDDELLGELLATLFPKWITAKEIWRYLRVGNESLLGRYVRFWIHDLIDTAEESDIATLMDECASREKKLSDSNTLMLRTCVKQLLDQALANHGDAIHIQRLYDWLDVGIKLRINRHENGKHEASIRRWIQDRPDLHAKLVTEGIRRLVEEQRDEPYEAKQRLYGASVHVDFYSECVISSTKLAKENRDAAESLLRFVVQTNAINEKRVRHLLGGDTELTHFANQLFAQKTTPITEIERNRKQSEVIARLHEKDQAEYEALKGLESEFVHGTARPAVLHGLAETYFDDFLKYDPNTAIERISRLAKSDGDLINAIKEGLRQVATRDDLPSVDESLQLSRKSKLHFLGWPLLASIALAECSHGYDPSSWSDDQMRKALAIYFGYAHGMYQPRWYSYLIEYKPAVVADVQVRFAAALLKDGQRKGDISLWQLAFDAKHKAVAKLAALPLLSSYPIGAKKELLSDLEYLLIAASQYADVAELKEIIASKLQLKSMPARQRARWLAIGCLLDLDKYSQRAIDFVGSGRNQTRLRDFLSFFCPQSHDYSSVNKSNLRLQAFLIHLVGPFIHPEDYAQGGFVSTEMSMSRRIHDYILNLANDPSSEASEALDSLRKNSALAAWYTLVEMRSRDQQRIRTDHEFIVPSFTQICEFLNNGVPTNPADLAALVISLLDEIADSIQLRDTDDWKQYWNEDGRGRPKKPKSENSCTKVLLAELRHRLPEPVKAELYGSYAGDTSSDIKILHKNFNVPIEAKGSWHHDLWYAAKSQLMTKYTIEPATNGFGIYLVYWFGQEHTKRAPNGVLPKSANELKRLLKALLTMQERRRIFVSVIDLSNDRED